MASLKYDPNQIFAFILEFCQNHRGLPPTLEDIMEEFNIPSKSTATQYRDRLARQGKIEMFRGRIMIPKSIWIYMGDAKAERLPEKDHNKEAIIQNFQRLAA